MIIMMITCQQKYTSAVIFIKNWQPFIFYSWGVEIDLETVGGK